MLSCIFGHNFFDLDKTTEGCYHYGFTNHHLYGYIAELFTCKKCSEEKEVIIKRTGKCYETDTFTNET